MKVFVIIMILVISVSFPSSMADTIPLKLGETMQYENIELKFYDIEDSRCPLDVTCVWEGQVLVMVNISNDTDTISARFMPGDTVSYITPYNVTLIDIQPHPVSTENPDYVATLNIINTEQMPLPNISPIRDYDYGLIYVVLISIVIVGMIGIMVFVFIKRKNKT